MPLVDIQLIEGVFSADQKRRMIEKVTDTMVEIEGEAMRGVTWVRMQEFASGALGHRGQGPHDRRRAGSSGLRGACSRTSHCIVPSALNVVLPLRQDTPETRLGVLGSRTCETARQALTAVAVCNRYGGNNAPNFGVLNGARSEPGGGTGMRTLVQPVAAAWRSFRAWTSATRDVSPTQDLELRAAARRERQRLETELYRHPRSY